MNLEVEIAAYLHNCEFHKKLSPKSIKAYRIDLRQYNEYMSSIRERDITKANILGYIKELHQDCKPRTAKRKLASLRAFLNHLEFEEVIEVNPIHKIRTKFQEPSDLPKTIPFKDIEQILFVAYSEQAKATTKYKVFATLRDIALLETLFATGARISEICSLKVSDVNLDDGTIRILGKGSKERIVQIGNGEVLSILRQYRKVVSSTADFFLSIAYHRASRKTRPVKWLRS